MTMIPTEVGILLLMLLGAAPGIAFGFLLGNCSGRGAADEAWRQQIIAHGGGRWIPSKEDPAKLEWQWIDGPR